MDFLEVIKKRKSVRNYLKKSISEDLINKILQVTNLAPSAGNLQAYKVFVVKNKKIIDVICKVTGGIQRNFENNPQLIMVFCADPKKSGSRYKNRGEKLYSVQDATIACTYAQLAATSFGLSSCWVGSFEEGKIREIIKTNLIPIAMLTIGYLKEDLKRPQRKSLREISKVIE